jgi:hypothetical protein
MHVSRRHLLTGSLTTAGLTVLPWTARGQSSWVRRIKINTTYTAKSCAPMVKVTRTQPGYSPTLSSVYQYLKQPGAPNPLTMDPFQAALELVRRPWFNALPDPLAPPPLSIVRGTKFEWLDTDRYTGFHPLSSVKRTKLVKTASSDRDKFRNRAKVQTQRICQAMLHRKPHNANGQDELAQGIRSLIDRLHSTQYVYADGRPWIGPATAWAELGDPIPPAAPPFGSSMAPGDYFPSPVIPADPVITHTALEIVFASAAFAEAASIMGMGAVALAQSIGPAGGLATFGGMSALGLTIGLAMGAATMTALGIIVLIAIVSGKPKPDGTWDTIVELAPLGSPSTGCSACTAGVASITPTVAPAMAELTMSFISAVPDPGLVGPVGLAPSDDGGAAPSADDADGGEF